jgi:nitrogen fixation protein FixH
LRNQSGGFLFFGDKITGMKTLLLALLFFNFLVAVAAQSTIQWQKTFGGSSVENARAVLQTAEGGFIVAG